MNLSAAIVDDLPEAIDTLISVINEYELDIEILGTASSRKQAIKLLSNLSVDIVFLDIELKDGTGFDVLDQIPNRNFEVIFVTACEQYTITALRCSAVDYLVKPFKVGELIEAVQRVKERRHQHKDNDQKYKILNENLKSNTPRKLALTMSDGCYFLNIDDILYLQGAGNYTHFFLRNRERLVATKNIGHFQNMFTENHFHRIHNEYIVNLEAIRKVVRTENYLIMEDERQLPISRFRIKEFIKAIEERVYKNTIL